MRHSARSEETLARPVHQSVTDEDLYEALRGYWHPAAYVSELADGGPLPVTLLDEPLVLARIDGAVSAFRDICVHRGTALSLGSVDESGLRCGYHGWTYNAEGRCTKIPSRPDLQIPSRARLTAHLAAEHLGLVWVCLTGDPVYPLPENPYFGDESFRLVEVEPYNWNCALPRRIENYVDFGHFAWVHDGVLGDSDHPEVPDHSIGRHRNELRFDHPHMAEPPRLGQEQEPGHRRGRRSHARLPAVHAQHHPVGSVHRVGRPALPAVLQRVPNRSHLPAFRNMLPVLWKEGQRRVCCRSCGRGSKASCWRSCSVTLNLKPVSRSSPLWWPSLSVPCIERSTGQSQQAS